MWEKKNFLNHAEHEAGKLVPNLFLLFKIALYKAIGSGQYYRLTLSIW